MLGEPRCWPFGVAMHMLAAPRLMTTGLQILSDPWRQQTIPAACLCNTQARTVSRMKVLLQPGVHACIPPSCKISAYLALHHIQLAVDIWITLIDLKGSSLFAALCMVLSTSHGFQTLPVAQVMFVGV